MTTSFAKDSRVRITNILGQTEDTLIDPLFNIVGKEGKISLVVNRDWLYVLVPDDMHYSTGNGALLRTSEVEAF